MKCPTRSSRVSLILVQRNYSPTHTHTHTHQLSSHTTTTTTTTSEQRRVHEGSGFGGSEYPSSSSSLSGCAAPPNARARAYAAALWDLSSSTCCNHCPTHLSELLSSRVLYIRTIYYAHTRKSLEWLEILFFFLRWLSIDFRFALFGGALARIIWVYIYLAVRERAGKKRGGS